MFDPFDPFNRNQTANSMSDDSEHLTYEKLMELAEQIPSMEFCALTISIHFETLLMRSLSKSEINTHLPFRVFLDSMNVYVVPNQCEGCIEWKDKDLLNLYLEMMEMKETKQPERLRVLQTISVGAGIDYGKLVLATLKAPTEHLTLIAPLVVQAAEEVPKWDFSDFVLPKLDIEMPKKIKFKGKANQNEPFYAKFTKKKKDKF